MKKRVVSMALAAALGLTALAGCGAPASEQAAPAAEETKTEDAAAQETAASDGLTTIYWQFPTDGGVSEEGLTSVEDTLNGMLAKEGIPALVEFVPCELLKSQQDATLMVSAGEQLDIMLTAFSSIDNLVSSNLILALDDIIEENAPDALAKSYSSTKCMYKGHIYGITTGDVDYNGNGYFLKTEYVDKYGLEIDPDRIYTMDELEEILAVIDEGEEAPVEFTVPWDDYEPGNRQYFMLGEPSGSLSAGAILFDKVGFESPVIENLFASEEYAEYAQRMYDWAQKGWIAADASVTTDTPDDRIKRDSVAGTFYWGSVTSEKDLESSTSIDWTRIRLSDYYRNGLGVAAIMWNIPATSADPALALQVINYIYKDVNAATLIQRGRQDIEWEAVETAEDGTIEQIRMLHENVTDGEYYQFYGIYGNTLDWPAVYPAVRDDVILKGETDKNIAPEKIFVGVGYTFAGDSVAAEIAAVDTVLAQYCKIINCGAADPAVVLPEFNDALKAAGIDTVIAENQSQLDAFMAAK